MEKIPGFKYVPDMITIGSALCAFDSGYSLENDDANLDVIRTFISNGNSI